MSEALKDTSISKKYNNFYQTFIHKSFQNCVISIFGKSRSGSGKKPSRNQDVHKKKLYRSSHSGGDRGQTNRQTSYYYIVLI